MPRADLSCILKDRNISKPEITMKVSSGFFDLEAEIHSKMGGDIDTLPLFKSLLITRTLKHTPWANSYVTLTF